MKLSNCKDDVSGVYTSPFSDTDDLKIALRARNVSGAFEKRALEVTSCHKRQRTDKYPPDRPLDTNTESTEQNRRINIPNALRRTTPLAPGTSCVKARLDSLLSVLRSEHKPSAKHAGPGDGVCKRSELEEIEAVDILSL